MSSAARILETPSGQPLDTLESYRIVAQLGQGGMAEVFLATRPQHEGEELVVIKRLHPHLDEDPAVVTMFLDEARIALRLIHPNVVRSYELGMLQGRHALVMEYLEGQPIHRAMVRAGALKSSLPCDVVVPLVAEALEALDYAHEAKADDGSPLGLVHRDVSPHNLLLTSEGRLKLLDFGIAKTAFQENRTRTGLLKGKVSYMAPEQAWGHTVDRRADLWSIGVVLWELLAGRRLFKAENEAASLHNTLNADIPTLASLRSDVPLDLDRIVGRALQRDPAHRYPSAAAMALELRSWSRTHAPDGRPGAARQLFFELFGEELAQQRRRIEDILAATENAPISGSLPRLHLPASVGNAAAATNLSTTVELAGRGREGNPVLPLLWSLLGVLGFAIGLLAYDVFTRPTVVLPAEDVAQISPSSPPAPATATATALTERALAPATAPPATVPPAEAPAAEAPAAEAAAAAPGGAPRRTRARQAAPAVKSAPTPAAASSADDFGYLTLDTSPWSSVSAGGISLGQTPLVRAKLASGTHTLVLVNPDQNLKTRYQVRIEKGKTTVRRIGLE